MTTTDEPLRYELRLTDRELFRVFLFGYFKRPFAILRRFIGFAIIAFGFHLLRNASDDLPWIAGPLCIAWGSWFVLNPLLLAWLAVRRRGTRGHVVVEVADDGVAISQECKRAAFGWDRVTEAGKLGDLVWFEIRGAAMAAIPLRVVADPPALLDVFRAHTRWRGAGPTAKP